jgi:hypothetical protein
MNFIKAYFLGLKTALLNFRTLIVSYLVNLLFGKFAARSQAFQGLLQQFDLRAVGDLVANYDFVFKSIPPLIIGLGLLYWVINIFLTGGILSTVKIDKFTMRDFFAGCGYNFFAFLIVDLISLLIIGGFTFAVMEIFGFVREKASLNIDTESHVVLISGIVVLALASLFTFALITYAKVMLVAHQSVNAMFHVLRSLAFIIRRFYVVLPMLLLLLVPPAFVIYAYFKFEGLFYSSTWSGVLIGFALQQVFILVRIFFRIWFLSSHYELYERMYFNPTVKVVTTASTTEENTRTTESLTVE